MNRRNIAEQTWHQCRPTVPGSSLSIEQRNRLAVANQGLVGRVAHQWADKCREPLEDLFQEGAIGLIRAINRYEPSKGIFSVFATRSIDSQIRHYLRDKGYAVKPPRTWVEAVSKVQTLHRASQKKGKRLTEGEAAIACGIAPGEYQEMVQSRRAIGSLPEGFEVAGGEPDEEFDQINGAVDRLQDPIRNCVVEVFYHKQSPRTLAKQHGVKQAQIRLWVQQGLQQMRGELEASGAGY